MIYLWLGLVAICGVLTALAKIYKFGPFLDESTMPPEAQNRLLDESSALQGVNAPQRVYQVAYNSLGNYLTLNTSVSQEVGCAQAVSWVLRNSGYPIPKGGISNVARLQDWMLKNGFTETGDYGKGYVITGRSPSGAHIGICGNTYIMSNTSQDGANGLMKGRFQANYRRENWGRVFPIVRFYVPPPVV